MSDKSFVTMEQCIICREETGTIMMDRRLNDSFERYTTTPTSLCDKCKETYLKKGVMMVNPETGSLVVIKDSAYKRIFDKNLPKEKIAFADEELITRLRWDK